MSDQVAVVAPSTTNSTQRTRKLSDGALDKRIKLTQVASIGVSVDKYDKLVIDWNRFRGTYLRKLKSLEPKDNNQLPAQVKETLLKYLGNVRDEFFGYEPPPLKKEFRNVRNGVSVDSLEGLLNALKYELSSVEAVIEQKKAVIENQYKDVDEAVNNAIKQAAEDARITKEANKKKAEADKSAVAEAKLTARKVAADMAAKEKAEKVTEATRIAAEIEAAKEAEAAKIEAERIASMVKRDLETLEKQYHDILKTAHEAKHDLSNFKRGLQDKCSNVHRAIVTLGDLENLDQIKADLVDVERESNCYDPWGDFHKHRDSYDHWNSDAHANPQTLEDGKQLLKSMQSELSTVRDNIEEKKIYLRGTFAAIQRRVDDLEMIKKNGDEASKRAGIASIARKKEISDRNKIARQNSAEAYKRQMRNFEDEEKWLKEEIEKASNDLQRSTEQRDAATISKLKAEIEIVRLGLHDTVQGQVPYVEEFQSRSRHEISKAERIIKNINDLMSLMSKTPIMNTEWSHRLSEMRDQSSYIKISIETTSTARLADYNKTINGYKSFDQKGPTFQDVERILQAYETWEREIGSQFTQIVHAMSSLNPLFDTLQNLELGLAAEVAASRAFEDEAKLDEPLPPSPTPQNKPIHLTDELTGLKYIPNFIDYLEANLKRMNDA